LFACLLFYIVMPASLFDFLKKKENVPTSTSDSSVSPTSFPSPSPSPPSSEGLQVVKETSSPSTEADSSAKKAIPDSEREGFDWSIPKLRNPGKYDEINKESKSRLLFLAEEACFTWCNSRRDKSP